MAKIRHFFGSRVLPLRSVFRVLVFVSLGGANAAAQLTPPGLAPAQAASESDVYLVTFRTGTLPAEAAAAVARLE